MTLVRREEAVGRVTQIELFFDLVYVFAVTQLSQYLHLGSHLNVNGAIETAVLLAMVWQIWVYTTWMTNYLDPNHQMVRLALVLLMFGSLVLAAAIPNAFTSLGWVVAIAYTTMQAGRSLLIAVGLRGHVLAYVYWRAGAWSVLAAVSVLIGAAVHGHAREALWALAVLTEVGGSLRGFPVPGMGHSETSEWTIDGGHFAERCQAFVLIALGESIVVSGTHLSEFKHAQVVKIAAFVVAFATTVALWWLYFDRAAEDSARKIASSDDPGRLGRNAFHLVHPVIIAGIIVAAAADQTLLDQPTARGVATTSWLLLGGAGLFLAGHAIFKAIIWQLVSWPRVIAVGVLGLLAVVAPHVTALVLAIAVLVVILAVIVADRVHQVRQLQTLA